MQQMPLRRQNPLGAQVLRDLGPRAAQPISALLVVNDVPASHAPRALILPAIPVRATYCTFITGC
jgi:hypothetical protein